jgi:tRNA (guanine37-N1)-methyltransferase
MKLNVWGLLMSEKLSLRIPKNYGRKGLTLARDMNLLNRELKVEREQNYLHIPLIREPIATELNQLRGALPEFGISPHIFLKRVKEEPKLVNLLSEKLPPHVLASLPRAIDFIGKIAVVEIPPELEGYKRFIGEAMLRTHNKTKTVLAKWGAVSGVYRLRPFEVIAGEAKTETIHTEYGCIFHIDLAKAYFSPRLSYEHSRVASLVKSGETVVDMFAGVGPFSVLIAKKHEDVSIFALDVNPDAFKFLRRNVIVNRVMARITPIRGDARQIIRERLGGVADRVIMNLPEKAVEYVDVACIALKAQGGVIHYYQFSNTPQPVETTQAQLTDAVGRTNRSLKKILYARVVRGVAPFTYQVAVDAEIK